MCLLSPNIFLVLDSEDKLDIHHLTSKEQRAFHSAFKRGLLNTELKGWEPWWYQVSTPSTHRLRHENISEFEYNGQNTLLIV